MVSKLSGQVPMPKDTVVYGPAFMIRFNSLIKKKIKKIKCSLEENTVVSDD